MRVILSLMLLLTLVKGGLGRDDSAARWIAIELNMTTDNEVADYRMSVKKMCTCRQACQVMPSCNHVTALPLGEVDCLIFYQKFSFKNLTTAAIPGTVTIHWYPKYELQEKQHYKLHTSQVIFHTARNTCFDEGGQLAVIDTEDKRKEVTQFLDRMGVLEIWLGLLKNKKTMEIFWLYRKGDVAAAHPEEGKSSCFKLWKIDGVWSSTNKGNNCFKNDRSFLCQRNF